MRRSNVGVLLDDYLGRSERTMAEAGTVAEMTQRLRDRLGAPAFYTFAQRQEALARSWWEQPPPTEYPGAGDVFQMDGVAWSEQLSQVRHRKYLTGAILLGVGLILTGPGLAFIPWTLGLSSIAATPGIPILIAGISLMAINGRRRP